MAISHARKGGFKAVAVRDFDTSAVEFWPVATLVEVRGMANDFEPGEEIPCRGILVKSFTVEV